MNSRNYAQHLRELANFLDARPELTIEHGVTVNYDKKGPTTTLAFYNKDNFIAAAKVVGSATKEIGEGEYSTFYLNIKNMPLKLSIPRDKVCRKVVKFECEPLFSSEELESIGG